MDCPNLVFKGRLICMNRQSASRVKSVLHRVVRMYRSIERRKQKYSKGPLSFTCRQLREKALVALGIGLCPYCLSDLTLYNFSPDHLDPISLGGSHDLDNIEFVCLACNMAKGPLGAKEYEYSKMWQTSNIYTYYKLIEFKNPN